MLWVLAWLLCALAATILGVTTVALLCVALENEDGAKAITGLILLALTAIAGWGVWALYISGASVYVG